MAIYHFSVSIVSRARGQRIVAVASALSAAKLRDEYYGLTHDGTRKTAVELSEIRAPPDAPQWVYERELLWNRVEAAERRKDAQLARSAEMSLPVELTVGQGIELLREYVDSEFVAEGMIADIAIRRAKPDQPTARVLLTLRKPDGSGFGPKVRHWNRKHNLLTWRSAWAERANVHLARAGHRMRIDHRSLEAQQIELTPARKIGIAAGGGGRMLPQYLQDRLAEQKKIARENGGAILQDPSLAVRALTRQRSMFTRDDLVRFLTPRTADARQLDAAVACVMGCTELVAVVLPGGGPAVFTSRDMIEAEKSLMRRAHAMAARRGHPTPDAATVPGPAWPVGLHESFMHCVGEGDFKSITLPDDTQNEFLSAARAMWDAHGFRMRVGSPTEEEEPLAKNDVLVIAGAEMIELKALEKLMAAADRARAKLVLVADPAQLTSMGSISPMQGLHDAFGCRVQTRDA